MRIERRRHDSFVDCKERVRDVLAVLAVDSARLGSENVLAVGEVFEPVAFEIHDEREILSRDRNVIRRQVVGRVRISARTDLCEYLVVDVRGIPLGATEHHVLEEVRKACVAVFELVARSRAHDQPEAHEPAGHADDDRLEPVVERFRMRRKRDHSPAGRLRETRADNYETQEKKRDKPRHVNAPSPPRPTSKV